MTGRMTNRAAVVTGATSGIGLGTARALVKAGAHLIFTARSADLGMKVQAELREIAAGGQVYFVRADVSEKNQIEHVLDEAVRRFGRVDALVNNAQGIPPVAPIMTKPDSDFDYSFRSGVMATKWAMQRVFPIMRDQGGGAIVNTTSGWAAKGAANTSDYTANKAALEGLTRTAANEWGQYNIRVNIVAPTSITPGFENWARANPELAKIAFQQNPLRRFGDPERDLGALTLGLVTDEACYITGQTFDGGGGNIELRRTYSGTDEMVAVDFQKKH